MFFFSFVTDGKSRLNALLEKYKADGRSVCR
jgi:hypothetical protein